MPDHYPQKYLKTLTVTRFFFIMYFKRHRLGFSNLGFRIKALFYCFLHSISSTFYFKSSSLIIRNESFKKRRSWLSFFSTYFKRPRLGFDFNLSFTVLCTPFLRNSILIQHAWSLPKEISKNVNRDSVFFYQVLHTLQIRVSELGFRF